MSFETDLAKFKKQVDSFAIAGAAGNFYTGFSIGDDTRGAGAGVGGANPNTPEEVLTHLENSFKNFEIRGGHDISVSGSLVGGGFAISAKLAQSGEGAGGGGPGPTPTGACCIGTNCFILTSDDCVTLGGTYKGDAVECTTGICTCPYIAAQGFVTFTGITIPCGCDGSNNELTGASFNGTTFTLNQGNPADVQEPCIYTTRLFNPDWIYGLLSLNHYANPDCSDGITSTTNEGIEVYIIDRQHLFGGSPSWQLILHTLTGYTLYRASFNTADVGSPVGNQIVGCNNPNTFDFGVGGTATITLPS